MNLKSKPSYDKLSSQMWKKRKQFLKVKSEIKSDIERGQKEVFREAQKISIKGEESTIEIKDDPLSDGVT